MGYIEKSLGDGERVIAKFKIHWYAYLWLFAILGLLFTEIALTSKKVIVKTHWYPLDFSFFDSGANDNVL